MIIPSLSGIFQQKLSNPEPVVGEIGEGYAVAMLSSIESADPSNEAALAGQLSIEIGRERGADISSLYRFSLANQHEVSTNQQALQTFLNTQ